jgi:hypothetical protein
MRNIKSHTRFGYGFSLISGILIVALSTPLTSVGASVSSPKAVNAIAAAVDQSTGEIHSIGGSSSIGAVPVPTSSSSASAWGTYINLWNGSLSVANVTNSFLAAGCSVKSVQISPMSATSAAALGFPTGAIPDSVGGVINCTAAQAKPMPLSVGAGSQCVNVAGPGSQCVNGCTYNGIATICASYLFEGTGISGHTELSTDGAFATSCSVGNLVSNAPQFNRMIYGDDSFTYDLSSPTGSNVWNSNFWKGTGSPWTNEGNACAAI